MPEKCFSHAPDAYVQAEQYSRISVVEILDGLMLGADRDLVKVWEKRNAPRFDAA